MANMFDYISWRGDLPASVDGWNEIDALIMATCCYSNFPDTAAPGARRSLKEIVSSLPAAGQDARAAEKRNLLAAMAASKRFGSLLFHDFVNVVDTNRGIQFSAVTADAPDGSAFVAFRGTDSTLVGWKEDFMMAFETPVPAQTAAVQYLERIAAGQMGPLRLTGHSKGGNLAVYAAMNAAEKTAQERVAAVYSFDGPGLDEASILSEGYRRVRGRIRSFVPQASIVGMLLAYHPEYTVVKSDGLGIAQHYPKTWQVLGPRFVEMEQLDRGSEVIDQTLHEWLRTCSSEQRRVFVNTLFDILQSTNAVVLSDMRRNVRASAMAILEATRRVDPATGRMIWQLLGRFVQIGAGSLLDMLNRKSDGSAEPGPG